MDSSSDRQENLGGNTQPENKLQQKDEYWRYIPLVKAALEGNWESAKMFFDQDEVACTVPITNFLETALHIAVGTGKKLHFVKSLVNFMPLKALELLDARGNTALHTAARAGNIDAAKVLVEKHQELLYICSPLNYRLPNHVAARHGRKDTLPYLLSVTKDDHPECKIPDVDASKIHHVHVSKPYQEQSGIWLLMFAITSEFYDVALKLIHRYPELATSKTQSGAKKEKSKIESGGNTAKKETSEIKSGDNTAAMEVPSFTVPISPLANLAENVSSFPSGSRLNFWQRIVYSCVPLKVESCCKSHRRGDIEDQMNTSPISIYQKYNWARLFGANFCISAHKVNQELHLILWKVFEFAVPQIKGIREKKQMHDQVLQLAKCLCKEIQSLNDSDAYESHAKDPLFRAAKLGIHEVVEEIVDSFPSLVWATDSKNRSIFHHAIVQRHENVFNLLYQMSEHKRSITIFRDNNNNTTLHMAGQLGPRHKLNLVPGAALQMQRELQWFEEVKKFVIPYYMHRRNDENKTAEMVFTEKHKALVVKGEKWMKETATSCTVAAALIATIAFAAAISVPGGNNDANGLPILSNETAFLVFAISNAFSLFTSTTSLVMFLSILSSNFAEKDFLFALPKRLIIGLVTLFFSITSMMIAFGSIVYLLFSYNKRWVLIPTGVFTSIPIISFAFLEFPLLLDLITSYGGGIFGKKSNRLFY